MVCIDDSIAGAVILLIIAIISCICVGLICVGLVKKIKAVLQRVPKHTNVDATVTTGQDRDNRPSATDNKEFSLNLLLQQYNLTRNDLQRPCTPKLQLHLHQHIKYHEEVGRYLGLTEPEIIAIQRDKTTEENRRLAVLKKWQLKNEPNATRLALVECFIEMQNRELAEEVIEYPLVLGECESLPQSQINYEKLCPEWSDLNEEGKQKVIKEFINAWDEVYQAYHLMLLNIKKSFKDNKVDPEDVKLVLEGYIKRQLTKSESSSLSSLTTTLTEVSNDIYQIFSFILEHTSWIEHQLLETVVSQLGNDQAKELLSTYKMEYLIPYIERPLFEVPSHSFITKPICQPIQARLIIHDDVRLTVQEAKIIEQKLTNLLRIPSAQLAGHDEGSIELLFQIPKVVYDSASPDAPLRQYVKPDEASQSYVITADVSDILLYENQDSQVILISKILQYRQSKTNHQLEVMKKKLNRLENETASAAFKEQDSTTNQKRITLPSKGYTLEAPDNHVKRLERHFSDLITQIIEEFDRQHHDGSIKLVTVATYVQNRLLLPEEIKLTNSADIRSIFGQISPYYDFLECEIIKDLVNKFIKKQVSIVESLQQHIADALEFSKSTSIGELVNNLSQVADNAPANISNLLYKMHIKATSEWGRQPIQSFYKLFRFLIPQPYPIPSLAKHISIYGTGSISIDYAILSSHAEAITDQQCSRLLKYVGIFFLSIGDMFEFEDEKLTEFSFGKNFLKAAEEGEEEVVEFLLDVGVDINYVDINKMTALMASSEQGQTKVVQLLLQNGADVNMLNETNWTALIAASDNGHTEAANLLLKYNADPNLQMDSGWTALMGACENGYYQIAKQLLLHKADPNAQMGTGWSALMAASEHGHLEVVELLLQHNADPNAETTDGYTALMAAHDDGHDHVVERLKSVTVI